MRNIIMMSQNVTRFANGNFFYIAKIRLTEESSMSEQTVQQVVHTKPAKGRPDPHHIHTLIGISSKSQGIRML